MRRPRPRHVVLASALTAAVLAVAAPVGLTVVDRMTAEPLPADFFGPASPAAVGHDGVPAGASRSVLRDPVGATTPPGGPVPGTGTPGTGLPGTAGPTPTTTPDGTAPLDGAGAGPTADDDGVPGDGSTPDATTTPSTRPSTAPPATTPPTTAPPTVAPRPAPTPHPSAAPTSSPRPTPEPEPEPTTPPAPKPKPTPTPEPAPSPAPPARTGRPTASTTGVPEGTRLTVHEGDLTITKAGTVVDGLDIRGFVRVKADDVVIKNSIVRGRDIGAQNMHLVQMSTGFKNLVVRDTTLASDKLSPYIKGIVGWNFTLDRVRIHRVVDQVSIIGDNVTIKNSLLNGNLFYEQDPNYQGTPTHDDNIQISIGTNLTFINNVMTDTTNAAIMVTQDRGHVSNMRVENNFMDGGACTVNLAEKAYGPLQGIAFRDNTFGVGQRIDHCGIIRPITTTIVSEGNTFTDGHAFVIKRG